MRTVLRLIARLAEDTDGALATIKHRPRTSGSPSWRARYVTGIVGMTPGRPAQLLDLVEGHCARSTGHGFRNFDNYRLRLLLAHGTTTCDHGRPQIRRPRPRFVA
jgi:hypothetical protein